MSKFFLTLVISFCILFNIKGQEIKGSKYSPKITIRKLKKNYNKGDTIVLAIRNSDTCLFKLLIETEILIDKKWCYEDSLTYLINNSISDKLIPYYNIQSNGFLEKKFFVYGLIKSKANKIRYRISIFKSVDSLDEPFFYYTNSFYNCRLRFLE